MAMTFPIAPMSNVLRTVDHVARETRLLLCIPFAFRRHRLRFLLDTLRILSEFPVQRVEVIVYTDTSEPDHLAIIGRFFDLIRSDDKIFSVQCHTDLDHPFALPWMSKPTIPGKFLGSDLTHWFYIEDDARFTYLNLCYFIYAREILRPHGLIPSFVRYEWNDQQADFFGTDHHSQADVAYLPHIDGGDVFFTTLNSVFNATIVLDQELAAEFVQTRSFDRERSTEVWNWAICERAAMGLAWENVPPGHLSRLVIPVVKDRLVPATPCLIHHLPNNYTDGWFAGTNPSDVKLGRLRISKLFYQNGDPGFDRFI
jgi:hypothetical protein